MDSRNDNGSLQASHHQPVARPSYLILPFSVRTQSLSVVDQGVRFESGPREPEGIGMHDAGPVRSLGHQGACAVARVIHTYRDVLAKIGGFVDSRQPLLESKTRNRDGDFQRNLSDPLQLGKEGSLG
jgi:hypothetical protein